MQGIWGLELFEDMNCATNPVHIAYSQSNSSLSFRWPKTVDYSDGTSNDRVSFTVVGSGPTTLVLERDRDGVSAKIVVAEDGKSFQYKEEGPNEGSRFDRCEGLSS